MLSSLEVVTVLLIYFLGTSRAAVDDAPAKYHFSYVHSLEDIIGLSCTRSAILSLAYAVGMKHLHRCAPKVVWFRECVSSCQ